MEYIGDYYARLDERRRIQDGKSELLLYCLDLVDASLWSLAGGEDPQALVQLDGCIEIMFKAALETVHRVLIADTKRLDYESLKRLLREAFLAHPRGRDLQIDDYDIEHTITFTEAKRRARDLIPALRRWEKPLDTLHSARNDIVHYGPNRERAGDYARMIATIGFPCAEDMLAEVGPVSLERLVTPPVRHELLVAQRVCENAQAQKRAVASYCLRTVRRRVLHDRVQWPHPDDDSDVMVLDHREHEMAERVRRRFENRREVSIDHSCRICDWYPAFVAIETQTEPTRRVLPVAFECPKCGLTIDEPDLAAAHIDDITPEETEKILRSVGE